MMYPWMFWTLGEAGVRATGGVVMKFIGLITEILSEVFFVLLVVGTMQVIGALWIARTYHRSLRSSRPLILWSILFGFNGFIASTLVFLAFSWGGDLGTVTFLGALSIVPGALIDWLAFHHALDKLQWLGIGVGLIGMYTILEFPSLGALATLPAWILSSLVVMMLLAINQGATQASKAIDPWAKNIYAGGATAVLAAGGLSFTGIEHSTVSLTLWIGAGMLGLQSIVLVWTNLMSYKTGARIAQQKLLMRGSVLVLAMIFGVLFFGEPLGVYKIAGVLLYAVALWLMQRKSA